MEEKLLVVMIPAFDEEKTIGEVIEKIPRKIDGIKSVKVLVIDDGSTDGTKKTSQKAGADKVVCIPVNFGLGNAFRKGVSTALGMKAGIIVTIDADGQFNPADIPKLIKPIINGSAEMVTCSRFKEKSLEPKMPWIKKFGNHVFTSIVNTFTGKKFTDTQCGFRAYSKEAALRLNTFGGHTYTQEVFLTLASKNLVIEEVACSVKGERDGKSKVVGSIFGYSVKAIMIILRTVRDYNPLAFFGSIGVTVFCAGLAIGITVFLWWLATGHTTPYTSLIMVSGVAMILGFLVIMLALLADMNGRQREIQEEILYKLKKQELK